MEHEGGDKTYDLMPKKDGTTYAGSTAPGRGDATCDADMLGMGNMTCQCDAGAVPEMKDVTTGSSRYLV